MGISHRFRGTVIVCVAGMAPESAPWNLAARDYLGLTLLELGCGWVSVGWRTTSP